MAISISSCDKAKDPELLKGNGWKAAHLTKTSEDTTLFVTGEYILAFVNSTDYTFTLDINTCGGRYAVARNDKINFREGYCTEACCDSELAADILKVILESGRYSVSEDTLLLEAGSDQLYFISF